MLEVTAGEEHGAELGGWGQPVGGGRVSDGAARSHRRSRAQHTAMGERQEQFPTV